MSPAEAERRELLSGAATLGLAPGPAQLDALSSFLELLYRWNESAGLTTIARADAARLHVLDSLCALPLLADSRQLGDLGSGAGLPGIPLAVMRPDLCVVLVEKKRRKCSFLREAVRELRLTNCEVLEGDAAELAAQGGVFETAIARAFLQPRQLLPVLTKVARERAIAMLGPTADAALGPLPPGWEQVRRIDLELPGGSGERRLLIALTNAAAA